MGCGSVSKRAMPKNSCLAACTSVKESTDCSIALRPSLSNSVLTHYMLSNAGSNRLGPSGSGSFLKEPKPVAAVRGIMFRICGSSLETAFSLVGQSADTSVMDCHCEGLPRILKC